MDTNITNIAKALGTFNSLSTSLTSEEVITPLTTDLSITKTADKVVWADGYLTYTVTVVNTSTTYDYENISLIDIIDPSIATLVEGSVTLNGTTTSDYTFNDTTGELVVDMGTVDVSESGTVTFQISKIS